MSAINVNSITGRTGTHGPVLTGVTTATNGLNVTGGSVGIGLTNPSAKLHAIGDVMIQGVGGTGEQSLFIGKSATVLPNSRGVAVAADQNSSAFHDMVLKTSTNSSGLVEKVRITSAGLVGIGTDNPQRNLQLHSDAAETVALQLTNGGTGATTDNSGFTLKIGSVGQVNLDQRTTGQDIIVYTGNSERMRIGATGVTTFASNVSLNNSNLVVANGYGIDFSATSDGSGTATSELLDDYEEGTWTPSLGGNATYSTQQGFYTKIGNIVTVTFYIVVSTIGTGSNRIMSGLPYAAADSTGGGPVAYWASTSQGLVYISMYIWGSSNLAGYVSGQAVNTLVASSLFTSGTALQAILQYRAA